MERPRLPCCTEALHLAFTELQQTGGFAYAQPPACCILNHFHPLELFLTHRHHPYRVTKSRCSYGVTLSWSIYINSPAGWTSELSVVRCVRAAPDRLIGCGANHHHRLRRQ